MMKGEKGVVIETTTPDQEVARSLSKQLLEQRLAACIQILGPLESHYWWEGQVQVSQEFQLRIKTRKDLADTVAEKIRELHPYEVPEILVWKWDGASRAYRKWIKRETRPYSPL